MNHSPVPAVEVLSANKTYSNGTQALLPLDLRIEEGEFVTLLGPSGCGKSTLLKMVAGLLDPTDGRLLLWRKPVQQLAEVGKKMSFVFQSPTLMPWATVEKNVRLPLPKGVDGQAVACFNDHPYDIPNTLVDYAQRNTNVPVGFWRTVGHSQNPFGRECFIDEMAQAAAQDPVQYRLAMLPNNEKANRDRAILLAVTNAAGWDKKPAPGVFRGVAATDGYGSWTACVCDVSINAKNEVKIHRIVIGIDPGYAVNPDNIVAQFQGSVVHGLTAIFWGENTIKDGRVEQSNFHDYRMMRLNEMPKVEVVIAPTGGFWGGVGEPAQAPLAPAVANAVSAALGKRIRSLPLKNHGLTLARA